MSGDRFAGNKYGMVFSIDIMMALIIITVILGVLQMPWTLLVLKWKIIPMEILWKELPRLVLICWLKTPGNPENWEKFPDVNGVTPGLSDLEINKKPTPT
jgi:hypothetical protein